jgi:hypothetical protein
LISRGRVAVLAILAASACLLGVAGNGAANHSQQDLISIGPNGGNGTATAEFGRVSADGSRVYFTTPESLDSADTDSSADVYERVGSTTTLISTGPTGGNGANDVRLGGISADGAHVFFDTIEALTSSDTDGARDVYERFGGTTTEVSIGPTGGNSAIDSFYVGNSTDGTRVFFVSYDGLTSIDTDSGRKDVYERSGATVTLVSAGGNGPYGADFDGATPDGTHVFFHTDEALMGTDTDGTRDVYERSGGTTTQVSTGPINGNGAFEALFKRVSQDGSRVFFETSEQLTTSDTDSYRDVYERSGGATTKLSLGPNGGNGAFDATLAGASADGSKVWLQTREPLVSGDTDGACEDEFENFVIPCLDVYERSGTNTTWITAGGNGSNEAYFGDASSDGTHVFFETTESFSAADTDPSGLDVYDRSGGDTTLVSGGGNGLHYAFLAGISKDGARVFFDTYEPLVSEDTDTWNDVYERYGGATTLISTGPASTSGDNLAFYDGASEDGTKVFFDTDERLTSADTDSQLDIYRASQVVSGFPLPRGAGPMRASLVPAYQACASPNENHGPPLAHPSCNPPAQESAVLTVGSPDANGNPSVSVSSVKYKVIPGAPGPPEDSEVRVILTVNDVRCRATNAACPGGANSDYTGRVLMSALVRVTDKLNGSPAVESATVQDFRFDVPVQCVATATSDGGKCNVTTTINSVLPGSILDGKRAIWQLDDIKLEDAGPNGTGYGGGCPSTCGDGDETVFMRSGIFIP